MDILHSKITSKGQITIPKQVRDELGLKEGDTLSFRRNDRGEMVIGSFNEVHLDPVAINLLTMLLRSKGKVAIVGPPTSGKTELLRRLLDSVGFMKVALYGNPAELLPEGFEERGGHCRPADLPSVSEVLAVHRARELEETDWRRHANIPWIYTETDIRNALKHKPAAVVRMERMIAEITDYEGNVIYKAEPRPNIRALA